MRTSSLTEVQSLRLAQFRVRKGVRWLNQHAPAGWQWNMFSMAEGGHVFFRAKDSYDNECVLALAFTHKAPYANAYGYVTCGTVAHHKRLDQQFLNTHGFHGTLGVPGNVLDIAWQEALVTYAKPPSIVHRHLTIIDLVFAAQPLRGFDWRSWWRRKNAA